MWLDRFVKIRGRHWLVGEVCPLGVNLVCYWNGVVKNFKIWDVEEVVTEQVLGSDLVSN